MRALVVDDDRISLRMMEAILAPYGKVACAANGDEGFALFEDALDEGEPFDVIFLDLMLPEINGQEILAAIREYEKGLGLEGERATKIVIISSLEDPRTVFQAHANLCDDYLVKPVRREAIRQVLERLRLIKKG